MKLSWTCVGCASGMPQPQLANSSYLLTHGKQLLLFDAGEGLSSALRRLKINPTQIGTIFISHMLSDHWIGLPLFLQMSYLLKRKERLDIFLPAEAVSVVRRLLNAAYLPPAKLPFELELHRITRSLIVEMKDMTIKPYPNQHLEPQRKIVEQLQLPNKLECYSFVIESGDRKIVYSGDIRGLEDIESILADTSLLVLEGMHVDINALPKLASVKQIKRVLLTHLAEDFDFRKSKAQFAGEGLSAVQQAKEGLTISV